MPNLGVYPFVKSDPPTALQQLRVLTNDDNPTPTADPEVGEYKFLSDSSALLLLSIYSDNPRLAAARELESIAVSEALMRVWRSDDLQVNGAATAEVLRKLAQQMREEVAAEVLGEDSFDVTPTGDDSLFDWPEATARSVAYREHGWF